MAEEDMTVYSLRFKEIDDDYEQYGYHRAIEDDSKLKNEEKGTEKKSEKDSK